jgi:DNA polymerase
MFNELLAEVGLDRSQLILMNRVRCRPPGNDMKKSPESKGNCAHWTEEEFNAYDPSVVVVMGGTAMADIFGATSKVGATRGMSRTVDGRVWIATYHPASLFAYRSPQNRPLVIADLMLAKERWQECQSQL